jgi:hypothetical protein
MMLAVCQSAWYDGLGRSCMTDPHHCAIRRSHCPDENADQVAFNRPFSVTHVPTHKRADAAPVPETDACPDGPDRHAYQDADPVSHNMAHPGSHNGTCVSVCRGRSGGQGGILTTSLRFPQDPTRFPTRMPTQLPTIPPTRSPTATPTTRSPTITPTRAPTALPTRSPTAMPTGLPTSAPSALPTRTPTRRPTRSPTRPTPAPSGRRRLRYFDEHGEYVEEDDAV